MKVEDMLLFKKGKKFNQKLGISLANIFLYEYGI